MSKIEETPDSRVLELLDSLQEVPPRNPEAASRGRENFMAEIDSLGKPVSVPLYDRLIGWMRKYHVGLPDIHHSGR